MARALEIDRLRVAYGATVACRDAPLDIEEGEVVALLGRNGAGKSSLVRCALGLRKPDGGSAKLFGLDAWTHRARLMERVGVVPEEPDVPPGLTAAHVVSALALIHRRFDRSAVLRALDRFEVPRRRAFGRLSKGQKSLAQLAFSSGHAPDLLVLDDPTLGVDVVARDLVFAHARREAERGCSILLVTHDMAGAESVARRVVVLREGSVVARGTPAELVASAGASDLASAFARIVTVPAERIA